MNNKNNFRLLSLALMLILIYSCEQKEIENPYELGSSLTETLALESDGQIVLGKKLENPYSVKNMRRAYASLMEKNKKSGKVYTEKILEDSTAIEITDYYVKFWIENDEQKNLLFADSLNLSITPIDIEIEQEGDYFVDENTEIEQGQWLYTSVEKDYQFHPEVTYETIEDLFLIEEANSDEDEDDDGKIATIGGKSGISKKFLYDLEDEALLITGNWEEPEEERGNQDRTATKGSKKRPQGYIKVINTITGAPDPVVGVKVKTRRWFKWGRGWTDSQGYYSVNRKYRRSVRYSVVFKNTRGFKIWRSIISISSARYRAGKHSKYGYDITFTTSSIGWRWSTVNNATVKYLDYCTQFGIGKPHSNLRIVANGKSGGGAAPMLRRTLNSITAAKVGQFLTGVRFGIPTSLLWIAVRFVVPDIIIGANANQGTGGVFEVTFHELGHASHYKKVGNGYWGKYIDKIIDNALFHPKPPYGEGRGNNHELVALGEAWGYHIGHFLIIQEFGNNNRNLSLNAFENFDPLERPQGDGVDKFSTFWQGWMPCGIMYDLMDTNADLVRTGFSDNVSGYTIRNIYDALDPGVESPQKFRDRLLLENGNRDANDVRTLFEAYYWD